MEVLKFVASEGLMYVCLYYREKRPGLQRWCATCQTHFTTNVIDHRKTKEHKVKYYLQSSMEEVGP